MLAPTMTPPTHSDKHNVNVRRGGTTTIFAMVVIFSIVMIHIKMNFVSHFEDGGVHKNTKEMTPPISNISRSHTHDYGNDDNNNGNDNGSNGTTTDDTSVNMGLFNVNKPTKHFLIHVGPPKTGTSTIECQLQVNQFLNASKYKYLGQWETTCPRSLLNKKKTEDFYHPMRKVVSFELINGNMGGLTQRLKQSLDTLYAQDYNAIVSSEAFQYYLTKGEGAWKFLASFTEQIPHKVTFVMTYRIYYEWLFSYHYYVEYHQVNSRQQSWEPSTTDSIFDFVKKIGLDVEVERHDSTGPKNETLTKLKGESATVVPAQSSPIQYFRSFTKYFGRDNVVVFSMHGGNKGDDMVSRFICDVFPDSKEACKGTTEDAINNPLPISNIATSYDRIFGDRIGVAAYEKGLIKKEENILRWYVRNAVIARVSELGLTFQDLPLKCVSQSVQDKMLQQSIEHEHEILGKDHSNEELLTEKFLEFKEKKWKTYFCNPDEEVILSDESWIQFFKNLTGVV
mmetsp:Transcript_21506/g.26387  ORF Transcript_21506/g.26387 Transcript_21506/m.26387 type:complete len:509 (-) Transcript_21506:314-1840(-)